MDLQQDFRDLSRDRQIGAERECRMVAGPLIRSPSSRSPDSLDSASFSPWGRPRWGVPVPGEAEEGNPTAPLGLRLAIIFVWLVTVSLLFGLLGSTTVIVITLISTALAERPCPEGLTISMIIVVAEMIVAGMLMGAIWLAMHLEGLPTGTRPRPPARMIGLTMSGILVGAGIIAVLFWIPSIFFNDVSRTFPWPLIWGSLGGGAFLLYRHLDRSLPK